MGGPVLPLDMGVPPDVGAPPAEEGVPGPRDGGASCSALLTFGPHPARARDRTHRAANSSLMLRNETSRCKCLRRTSDHGEGQKGVMV